MQITSDDIQRFQEIWREEFREEIGADDARAHIACLDALYLLLAKPVPSRSDDKQHS
ncbi:MAG: hypothetical protein ACRD2T_17050 [Thermoanaerobaculia bacterium]